ncbi:MAG: aminotransferase class V-fold PLP-dependent enzyme [Chloroflexi bacterium]|nr:aminotransferase class V-fold PLP-dependent enzyme [Chloroflexota bacterium]
MRSQFLLDPEVVFLNHGSFGACPQPVFDSYQAWQRELEWQPVEFIGRRLDGLLDAARAELAAYVNATVEDLIFVTNATQGVNLAARAVDLAPGDEILTTDQEYGACERAWAYVCEQTGAKYIKQHQPLPVTTAAAWVEVFWAGVTPRTKVIYLSHITSPTALILPVDMICQRAREAGIITIVDGAHAPGHVPLDLKQLDADFYTGNCHKWLSAPKGSGFLVVRPEHHAKITPLVISWGWTDDRTLVSANQYQGTRDPAAFLAVPDAIRFQRDHDWDTVRAACHDLASETRQRIAALTGLPDLAPDSPAWYMQMFTAPLPPCDPDVVKRRLYDEFQVEVPIIPWNDAQHIRVSIQAYNTHEDADRLITALEKVLAD